MRPDFKKLLCEHERSDYGYGKKNKGLVKARQRDERQSDYEDWAPGAKRGIKRSPFGMSRKTKVFSENLSVLTNFLFSARGRKWNDVYSEIVRTCPKTSVIGAHVYQHLFQYVIVNPTISEEDGSMCYPHHLHGRGRSHENRKILSERGWRKFYVDPRTGILCVAPQRVRVNPAKAARELRKSYEVRVETMKWAVRPDPEGPWFWALLRKIPEGKYVAPPQIDNPYDTRPESVKKALVWQGPSISDVYQWALSNERKALTSQNLYAYPGVKDPYVRELTRYYGADVYCYELKQMGKADLRKLGLSGL